MKKFNIYKNYGVLTAEKRAAYTVGNPHAYAKCYDRLTVEALRAGRFGRMRAASCAQRPRMALFMPSVTSCAATSRPLSASGRRRPLAGFTHCACAAWRSTKNLQSILDIYTQRRSITDRLFYCLKKQSLISSRFFALSLIIYIY